MFLRKGGGKDIMGDEVKKMGICYIVGACPIKRLEIKKGAGDFVIACDGGMDTLKKFGIRADCWLGDMDSTLVRVQEGAQVYPKEKDETDLFLAIRRGLEMGYEKFVFFGALGGRLDHTLGNLALLVYLAKRGVRGYLVGDGEEVTAIYNGALRLEKGEGRISVLSAEREARGVSLRGLKYPLVDGVLFGEFPLGVSNEFLGQPAEIEVKEGVLWIVGERLFWEDAFGVEKE